MICPRHTNSFGKPGPPMDMADVSMVAVTGLSGALTNFSDMEDPREIRKDRLGKDRAQQNYKGQTRSKQLPLNSLFTFQRTDEHPAHDLREQLSGLDAPGPGFAITLGGTAGRCGLS